MAINNNIKPITLYNITLHMKLLYYIFNNKNEEHYTSQLSKIMGTTETQALIAVQRLIKLGLIKKEKGKDKNASKRISILKLTSKGEQVMPHLLEIDKIIGTIK